MQDAAWIRMVPHDAFCCDVMLHHANAACRHRTLHGTIGCDMMLHDDAVWYWLILHYVHWCCTKWCNITMGQYAVRCCMVPYGVVRWSVIFHVHFDLLEVIDMTPLMYHTMPMMLHVSLWCIMMYQETVWCCIMLEDATQCCGTRYCTMLIYVAWCRMMVCGLSWYCIMPRDAAVQYWPMPHYAPWWRMMLCNYYDYDV